MAPLVVAPGFLFFYFFVLGQMPSGDKVID